MKEGTQVPSFYTQKMITNQQIQDLIAEKLQEKNMFVVELDVKPGNNIKLEVDGMEGVSISDCVEFSRQIEHNLDREEEDFEVNVSSPGLDNPFKVFEQYQKNVGREVKVTKADDKVVKGKMIEATEEFVVVEYSFKRRIEGRKKKELITEQEKITFDNIKETRVIISFK